MPLAGVLLVNGQVVIFENHVLRAEMFEKGRVTQL